MITLKDDTEESLNHQKAKISLFFSSLILCNKKEEEEDKNTLSSFTNHCQLWMSNENKFDFDPNDGLMQLEQSAWQSYSTTN